MTMFAGRIYLCYITGCGWKPTPRVHDNCCNISENWEKNYFTSQCNFYAYALDFLCINACNFYSFHNLCWKIETSSASRLHIHVINSLQENTQILKAGVSKPYTRGVADCIGSIWFDGQFVVAFTVTLSDQMCAGPVRRTGLTHRSIVGIHQRTHHYV